MKTMPNQKTANWSGQESSKVSPPHHLQCEMGGLILPRVVDIVGRCANKSVPVPFSCPHIMYQAEFALIYL